MDNLRFYVIRFEQYGKEGQDTCHALNWDHAANLFRQRHPDVERFNVLDVEPLFEMKSGTIWDKAAAKNIHSFEVLSKTAEPTQPEPAAPSYRDNIVKMLDQQRAKGLAKYGETLEQNDTLTYTQRIEHAQEEALDFLQYLEHLKQCYTDRLTANDYQRAAMRTASGMDYSKAGENGLLLNGVMGLNGEAGECVDIVKKHLFQGHELDYNHLAEELGDVAWYLAVCCEAIGMRLEDVLQRNIDKLKERYPEGFDKARSINRKK